MILVDSSLWIDHLRAPIAELADVLTAREAVTHDFVIGEIAMGSIKGRRTFMGDLADLPRLIAADDHEVLAMIEHHELFGTGIGYIDAHLLAATRATQHARFWTRDRRLREAAGRLGIAYETIH